jgi:hypothetical protein
MLRFVAVLSLVAAAQAGAPIGAYGGAYAPALSYSAPPVTAVHAAPVAVGPAVHAVHAAPLAVAQPIAKAVVARAPEPFDPHPQYQFGYSVADSLTGDQHSHHETRDGGVVQGQYSLVEPDGAIRTVTYTSDPVNGFNAVVDRQRPAVAVAKAPVAVHAPIAHVAPAVNAIHAGPAYAQAVHAPVATAVRAYAPSYAQAAYAPTYAQAYPQAVAHVTPNVHAVHAAGPVGIAYQG